MLLEELLKPNDVLTGKHGDYVILNLIGRGGMGAVYRAQRTADATIWALKEMRPPPHTDPDEVQENRGLFKQEAALLAKLSHPNLPVLADTFEYDGRPVMVMEFVPGQTLEDQLRKTNAPLLEQQVLRYAIQLCRVLDYLHNQKPPIIYRDLKPPNVMVTPGEVLKVIDFGVARTHKGFKAKDTIAMGSAGYAPPEQYGKGETDARSDVYALGATMLHLLTGLPPVPLRALQRGDIRDKNPSVSAEAEQIVIKAMSLERKQRYASCADMEQAILPCLDTPYVDPTAWVMPPPAVPAAPPAEPDNATALQPTPTPPQQPIPTPAPQQPPTPPSTHETSIQPVPKLPPAPSELVCEKCGYTNKPNARFCARCGAPLSKEPTARLRIKSVRSIWDLQLDSNQPYRIGRRDPSQSHFPEIDLAEHDRGIASRHHATIQREGDIFTITDVGSTNGTMVNGERLEPRVPQRLRPGDFIKIGETEMEFRWT